MRAFLTYLIKGETPSARVFLPAAAGLLTAVLVFSLGLIRPSVGPTLYKARQDPPYALDQTSRYPGIKELAGQQDMTVWLKTELEDRLRAIKNDGIVYPALGTQQGESTDWLAPANADLRRWMDDYLCPVKGWERYDTSIRVLVWRGVGPCSKIQQWSAGIPALSWFGFGLGLAFLVALSALTLAAWALTFTFHHTRSAYRWLYRSRVF